MAPTSPLNTLPDVLVLLLLRFLDANDLVCLASADRAFRGYCTDDGIWRQCYLRKFHKPPPARNVHLLPVMHLYFRRLAADTFRLSCSQVEIKRAGKKGGFLRGVKQLHVHANHVLVSSNNGSLESFDVATGVLRSVPVLDEFEQMAAERQKQDQRHNLTVIHKNSLFKFKIRTDEASDRTFVASQSDLDELLNDDEFDLWSAGQRDGDDSGREARAECGPNACGSSGLDSRHPNPHRRGGAFAMKQNRQPAVEGPTVKFPTTRDVAHPSSRVTTSPLCARVDVRKNHVQRVHPLSLDNCGDAVRLDKVPVGDKAALVADSHSGIHAPSPSSIHAPSPSSIHAPSPSSTHTLPPAAPTTPRTALGIMKPDAKRNPDLFKSRGQIKREEKLRKKLLRQERRQAKIAKKHGQYETTPPPTLDTANTHLGESATAVGRRARRRLRRQREDWSRSLGEDDALSVSSGTSSSSVSQNPVDAQDTTSRPHQDPVTGHTDYSSDSSSGARSTSSTASSTCSDKSARRRGARSSRSALKRVVAECPLYVFKNTQDTLLSSKLMDGDGFAQGAVFLRGKQASCEGGILRMKRTDGDAGDPGIALENSLVHPPWLANKPGKVTCASFVRRPRVGNSGTRPGSHASRSTVEKRRKDQTVRLVTGHETGELQFWNKHGEYLCHVSTNLGHGIEQVQVDAKERIIVSADSQGNVMTWDVDQMRRLNIMRNHTSIPRHALSPSLLPTPSAGSPVLHPCSPLLQPSSHEDAGLPAMLRKRVHGVEATGSGIGGKVTCLSITSNHVFAGTASGQLVVWRRSGNVELIIPEAHDGWGVLCAVSPRTYPGGGQYGDSVVCTGGEDGVVSVWQMSRAGGSQGGGAGGSQGDGAGGSQGDGAGGSQGSMPSIPQPSSACKASVPVVGENKSASQITLKGHVGPIRQVHMDLHKVVSCGDDGTIKIWTVKGELGSLVRTLRWRGARSAVVAMTVGKNVIVGGCADGSVYSFVFGSVEKRRQSLTRKGATGHPALNQRRASAQTTAAAAITTTPMKGPPSQPRPVGSGSRKKRNGYRRSKTYCNATRDTVLDMYFDEYDEYVQGGVGKGRKKNPTSQFW